MFNRNASQRPALDWTFRTAAASIVLLLLSPMFWYERIYPQQFITAVAQAEQFVPAQRAYNRLRAIPFYRDKADRLWGEFGIRRMSWATSLDEKPDRGPDAYHLIYEALGQLKPFPALAGEREKLLAQFFERRAELAAFREDRDEAILWWLKAVFGPARLQEVRTSR